MIDKAALRSRIATKRKAITDVDRERQRAAIRSHIAQRLAVDGHNSPSRIAVYEPLPNEPGSIELLLILHRSGHEVVVPMTQPDDDLDWGAWTLSREARVPLGLSAIAEADLIFVPALAVGPNGERLGRGGGSYDRALARVGPGIPIVALLFEGELVKAVPTDEWDIPVSAAVTPSGWQDF
jgi:5-formyltetrahydrofolate cyclo-ligase